MAVVLDAVVGKLMRDTNGLILVVWPFRESGVINSSAKIDWRERLQELALPVRFIQSDWYGCRRAWKKLKYSPFDCPYLKSLSLNGQIRYTGFLDGYRNYGVVIQNSIIHRELKPYRMAIGRNYGLSKENRKYKHLYGPRQCPYAR